MSCFPRVWSIRDTGRICGLLAAVCLLNAGCSESSTPPAASAKLFVEQDVVPIGVIPLQDNAMEIPVRNIGTATLQIRSITASCTCTVAGASQAIAPGESGVISIQLKVTSPGPGGTRLTVSSNDPESPHSIAVSWFGEFPPTLAPRSIRATAESGESVEQLVSILYAGGDDQQPLTLREFSSTNPVISITYIDDQSISRYNRTWNAVNQVAIAGEMTFAVRCDAPLEAEQVDGECRFVVEQAGKEYELVMPVEVSLRPQMECIPPVITFVARDADGIVGMKREALLSASSSHESAPVVEHCPDFVECQLREDASRYDGGRSKRWYRLEVEFVDRDFTEPDVIRIALGRDEPDSALVIPVVVRTQTTTQP